MIRISKIEKQLGKLIQLNSDIEKDVGWSASQIEEKTGIKKRYLASNEQTTESLAIDAVKKISDDEISNVDLLIAVTNTPSAGFPNLAHFIHSSACFSDQVQCIGLNSGCSGFVDALEIVSAYFASELSENALIVTSDTYQKFILPTDRSIRTLFSDGACATLLKNDSSGMKLVSQIHSSHKNTTSHLEMYTTTQGEFIKMNGPQVLAFSLKVIKEVIQELPSENLLVLPHQAGKIVLQNFEKKLPDMADIRTNYSEYGNLVSSSIPNLLCGKIDELKNYENIVFSGFGVGLKHTSLIFKNSL